MGIFGGLYYLGFVVLILLAIYWCVDSERKGIKDSTAGLFGMRSFTKKPKQKQAWSPANKRN